MASTATIGSSNIVHALVDGAITCGAVRFRNTGGRQGAVHNQPAGTPVTCTRCPQAPVAVEAPAPLTHWEKRQARRAAGLGN